MNSGWLARVVYSTAVVLLLVFSGPGNAAKVARVGLLFLAVPPKEARELPNVRKFLEGMRDLGWTEGKNVEFQWRSAEGNRERIPGLVNELVRLQVDVLVVSGTDLVKDVLSVTRAVPIVMVNGWDPVGAGVVASLSRPGGSVTGMLRGMDESLWGKQAELLKEAIPHLKRLALLASPRLDPGGWEEAIRTRFPSQAKSLELTVFQVEAENVEELEGAFSSAVRQRADAMMVVSSLGFPAASQAVIRGLATKYRMPVMHISSTAVEAGGLIYYFPDSRMQFARAAGYADKILRGAKAGDLPIEQPEKLELLINLGAAKAIGLALPQSLLMKADRVFE
jgi:putative ABC transport system substrate-binding protein